MKETKIFYGLTKEQLDTLYEYFMNRTAKEALPYLKMLNTAVNITFDEDVKEPSPELLVDETVTPIAGEDAPPEATQPIQ